MKQSRPLQKVAGPTIGLVLLAGLTAGCSTSTEPTVQINFPAGTKEPEPYKGPSLGAGGGVTSQGNPSNYTK